MSCVCVRVCVCVHFLGGTQGRLAEWSHLQALLRGGQDGLVHELGVVALEKACILLAQAHLACSIVVHSRQASQVMARGAFDAPAEQGVLKPEQGQFIHIVPSTPYPFGGPIKMFLTHETLRRQQRGLYDCCL